MNTIRPFLFGFAALVALSAEAQVAPVQPTRVVPSGVPMNVAKRLDAAVEAPRAGAPVGLSGRTMTQATRLSDAEQRGQPAQQRSMLSGVPMVRAKLL